MKKLQTLSEFKNLSGTDLRNIVGGSGGGGGTYTSSGTLVVPTSDSSTGCALYAGDYWSETTGSMQYMIAGDVDNTP